MKTPWKVEYAAQRLKQGHRINRITVRDFLRHFGAERRGAVKVQEIRGILDSLDLETKPDFETAWIDGAIWLCLKDGIEVTKTALLDNGSHIPDTSHDAEEIVLDSTLSAVELEEEVVAEPISGEPEAVRDPADVDCAAPTDPTFRIGRLPAANKKLVVVNQNDSLTKAITLMLEHDFSQLPVMQGEREVKGMITWKSIGSRFAFGCKCDLVSDCREDAQVVNSDRTLFGAIPTIVEHGYVLVRDRVDKKITGIVTASDLSLEFQLLSEPFLLLREIELHVRRLLAGKIGGEDFDTLAIDAPPMPTPKNIAELTFGQYVRLVQHPKIWPKLNLRVDPGVLTSLLEEVRLIRNDVMHFDPDPMTGDELDKLKQTVNFMQRIQELLQ